jgi:hypothetical protein
MLPLTRGSVLVVDMSDTVLRSGLTNPSELLKLIRRGVAVYNYPTLHCKVAAFPSRAFVGSMNASRNSASCLQEAALELNEPRAIRHMQAFVRSLAAVPVGPEQAEAAQQKYRPPKSTAPAGRRRTEHHDVPLWLVPLEWADWDDEDFENGKVGRPLAEQKRSSVDDFRLEEFAFSGRDLCSRLKDGDAILQVMTETSRRLRLYPIGTIVHKQVFRDGRRAIVFVEVPKRSRPKELRPVVEGLGVSSRFFRMLTRARLVRNRRLRSRLLRLWPNSPVRL